MAMDFKTALRKLELIYNECAPEAQKRKEEEAKLDDFGRVRKSIHRNIKEIRHLITDRDEMVAKGGTSATARESAEASFKIRMKIKAVKEEAASLSEILKKNEKELGKGRMGGTGAVNDKLKAKEDNVTKQREIVELVQKHIEEVEALEKRRHTDKMSSADKAALFSSSSGSGTASPIRSGDNARAAPSLAEASGLVNPKLPYRGAEAAGGGVSGGATGASLKPTGSNLPEIDIEDDLKLIENRNQAIDEDLKIISVGVGNLKEIAQGMNRELDAQNEMLDKVETKVNDATTKLENINVTMKNNIEKVMKGDRFLVNCILLMILLGVAAFIASYLTGSNNTTTTTTS